MKFLLVILLFILVQPLFPQSKPQENNRIYAPIPGVSEKMNTEDIIQKLIYIKRLPIQKKEIENQDFKIETEIVKDFSKYLRELDTKSRALYDFQSPFGDMVGESSDKGIFEAYASRKAKKQDYKVTVFQTAKPDSFMSESIQKNTVLAASDFTIKIGDQTFHVKFPGGTVSQLQAAILEQAGKKIDTKLINDTLTSSILVISGKDTGEKNKISFDGDLKVLFDIGLLTSGVEKKDVSGVDFTKIVSKNTLPFTSDVKNVQIKPGNEGEVNLSDKSIRLSEKTILTFKAKVNKYGQKTDTNSDLNPNIDISLMEPVTVSNVTVQGGSLITFYEEKKEMPAMVSNFTEIFTLVFDDGAVKSYFIDTDGDFSNSLSTYQGKSVAKILVKNKNTDRDIFISDVQFSTKLEEGGVQPKNMITKACDSLINLDGVEIKRDNNKIDDLIDGVTLNLKRESKEPASLTVDHNYQKVEDSVTAWVDAYNKVMEYISILTKPNLDHTRLSERNKENLKDGIFQAESTFLFLRNKLRNTAINAYKTDYGRELALLEQIGLYTKKSGTFSMSSDEWNSAKMGLLNIESDKLKESLKNRFDGVAQLFANDTTGSLVKDSGVAVQINSDLRVAIGPGSFIENRIAYNDNKVKENNKGIDEMNRSLSDYEMQMRVKYGKMNQAIQQSDSKQKWLSGQFKN